MNKSLKRFIKFNSITALATVALNSFLSLSHPKPAYAVTVSTGLGDIDATPEGLAEWVLNSALGIASGVAFILILLGGIKFITSQGDPKAIQEAQKTITAAIVGFLVIFLSVLILATIGGQDVLFIKDWPNFFTP